MNQGTNKNQNSGKATAFDYGWRIFWLVASLFCVVMLPYVIFISMQDQTTLDTQGQVTIGTVIDKQCSTMSGGGDRQTCRSQIQLTGQDGQRFTFIEPRPLGLIVGQRVQVRYILRSSEIYDAQVITENNTSVNYIQWSIIGALTLLFGGIAIVCIRSLYQMIKGTWKGGE